MPARVISVPFLLLTALFAYLTLEVNESFSFYVIIFVLTLSVIYTFSPQINWWWYSRYPPEIDQPMRTLLMQHHSFYNNLSLKDKQLFRNRMALYMLAVEFMPKGWETLPEDIKGIIAANIVQMTLQQEDFLLPTFEQIVVYTTPFPSPQFPNQLHASEVFEEDGVFLFSAQQVMWSFLYPKQYYNLVMHEYIKAYRLTYPNKLYPNLGEQDWGILEQISGFTKNNVVGIIGLSEINPTIVSGTLFFTHAGQYRQLAPNWYQQWENIFG